MNAFTIGLLVGLAAVLLVAAITKFRTRDRPMSVAAKAEYLSKRRARMLPALAVIFLSQQASFFSQMSGGGACLGRESENQRLARPVGSHVLALATKGFWFEPREMRDLVDDENTRANRNEAMRWGFLFAMAAAIGVYILTMFDIVTGREATHIIMSFGIAAAILRWGVLERRAHRSA